MPQTHGGPEQVQLPRTATNINKQGLPHYERLIHTSCLHLLKNFLVTDIWSLWGRLNSTDRGTHIS